jgi:hypothetical protein
MHHSNWVEGIDKKVELLKIVRFKNNLRKQLNNVSVYPNIIPQLKEIIVKNYYKSLIHPGEMVGTIAASSIGANTTQESLNSFHSISGDMNIIFYDNFFSKALSKH